MLLNATCKAGKLQLDEGILRVVAPFNKIVWQVPTGAVTRIASQPSGLACTVVVHTAQGPYTIEIVTKANAEKLQSLFPHLDVQSVARATHWYQDITKRTHVETYTNQKRMQKDVEQAAQHGWTPQTSAGLSGHLRVGLLGVSRSKDKLTITYVRTPEWLAQNS